MTGSSADGRPVRFFFMLCIGWTGMRLFGTIASSPPPPVIAPAPSKAAWVSAPTKKVVKGRVIMIAAEANTPTNQLLPSHIIRSFRPSPTSYRVAPLSIAWSMRPAPHNQSNHPARTKRIDPLAISVSTAPAMDQKRWQGSAWLLWRSGGGSSADLATVGRLGGSQSGARLDFDLTPRSSGRLAGYGRVTTALQSPEAPETAIGLSYQPIRHLAVSLAAERRIALDAEARNAFALLLVGGFGPAPVAGPIEASLYAQTGMVGLHKRDLFIDGKFSLLAPVKDSPLRVGLSLSGGAQPDVERLDIGPEIQFRLPLPAIAARIGIEWRERVAGQAKPASGLAVTLAADF
ncbi:hypothetical protein N6H05_18980 [Sphingobium sp. WTD-1]|uniref:hypothetical protein n=1 Tax=Sphingobium sp. WTD-1 TaxID=2979467 RepID=UPI0024DE3AED|nr:hypothetical protein [Sphingobium sp. WTD-1]WIA55097.1 hypothetical protein N6H05_18980 [Sphingobium sp. WTD-1]